MRYYEGLARLALGRSYGPETAKRAEHLERAETLLSECGVGDYAASLSGTTTGSGTARRIA